MTLYDEEKMENDSVSVFYQYSPEDVLHGLRVFDSRNALSWKSRLKIFCISILYGILLAYLIKQWIWIAVVPIGMIALSYLSYRNTRPRQVRAMFNYPSFAGPFDMVFDQIGIHFKGAYIESHVKWSVFFGIIESPKAFLLLKGTYDYQLVPKHAFISEEQVEVFRKLISANIIVK